MLASAGCLPAVGIVGPIFGAQPPATQRSPLTRLGKAEPAVADVLRCPRLCMHDAKPIWPPTKCRGEARVTTQDEGACAGLQRTGRRRPELDAEANGRRKAVTAPQRPDGPIGGDMAAFQLRR